MIGFCGGEVIKFICLRVALRFEHKLIRGPLFVSGLCYFNGIFHGMMEP